MKKILVTGASGYIGQHLCKLLSEIRPEYDVYKLDNFFEEGVDNYRCFELDIRKPQEMKASLMSMHHYDAIIHLAALVQVGQSVQFPTAYYNTNINGTMWLARMDNFDKFIFASTGAAEGLGSPYGISKRVAEDILRELRPNATIFRFYNVIGQDGFSPTNPDGLFYNLIKAAEETNEFNLYGTDYNTKDGTCVREYVHVNDICHSLIEAIDRDSTEIQNLAYGDTRTVKEIIELFKSTNNVDFKVNEHPRRPGDLEACYLEKPSDYMIQRYSYEEMFRYK